MSAAEDRRAWGQLLADAGRVAKRVRDGEPVPKLDRSMLAGAVIRMKARPFPLRFPTAAGAADAFLTLARGFVAADASPLTARGLAAVAADLEAMLEADTRAAFARSCRAVGED